MYKNRYFFLPKHVLLEKVSRLVGGLIFKNFFSFKRTKLPTERELDLGFQECSKKFQKKKKKISKTHKNWRNINSYNTVTK